MPVEPKPSIRERADKKAAIRQKTQAHVATRNTGARSDEITTFRTTYLTTLARNQVLRLSPKGYTNRLTDRTVRERHGANADCGVAREGGGASLGMTRIWGWPFFLHCLSLMPAFPAGRF